MYKKNITFSGVIAVFLTSVPALAAVSENYQITSKAYVESQLADKQDKLTDKSITVQGAGDVVTGIDVQNGQVVVKKDATLPTMDANVEIIDLNEYGKDAPEPSNIVTNFEVEDGKIKVTKGGRVTYDDLDEELADNINAITGILDEGWWQTKLTSHQDEADIITDLNGETNLKINGTGNVVTDIDASWGVVTVTKGNVEVQDNEVTSAKIADGTITYDDLGDDIISSLDDGISAYDQLGSGWFQNTLTSDEEEANDNGLANPNLVFEGTGNVVTNVDARGGVVTVTKGNVDVPTVNNATLTIKNGATNTDLATFTANSSTAATATIPAATPTVAGLAKYGQIPLGSATSTTYTTIWVE